MPRSRLGDPTRHSFVACPVLALSGDPQHEVPRDAFFTGGFAPLWTWQSGDALSRVPGERQSLGGDGG
eukprot:14765713-Alexandrium_andersonii.AAC.1